MKFTNSYQDLFKIFFLLNVITNYVSCCFPNQDAKTYLKRLSGELTLIKFILTLDYFAINVIARVDKLSLYNIQQFVCSTMFCWKSE